jgi:hypothetical protein
MDFIITWKQARCWWLMPIILATWEAEIGRIKVPSQCRQRKKFARHIAMEKHLGMVVMPVIQQ